MNMGTGLGHNEMMGSQSEELKMEIPTADKLDRWINEVWDFIAASQRTATGASLEFLRTFNQKEDVASSASNAIHGLFGGEGRALCAIRRGERIVGIASLAVRTSERTMEPKIYLIAEEQKRHRGLDALRDWMLKKQEQLGYGLIATAALSRPEAELLARLDIELDGTYDKDTKKQKLKFRNLGS